VQDNRREAALFDRWQSGGAVRPRYWVGKPANAILKPRVIAPWPLPRAVMGRFEFRAFQLSKGA